ncbi:hypothetical protein FOXYSP1_02365 [Fusarium oxysporum f. sp. phaseoli]
MTSATNKNTSLTNSFQGFIHNARISSRQSHTRTPRDILLLYRNGWQPQTNCLGRRNETIHVATSRDRSTSEE